MGCENECSRSAVASGMKAVLETVSYPQCAGEYYESHEWVSMRITNTCLTMKHQDFDLPQVIGRSVVCVGHDGEISAGSNAGFVWFASNKS